SLSGADSHHLHPHCRPFVLRYPGELQENGASNCRELARGIDPGASVRGQMAQSFQRVHYGHQCGYSCSLAGFLAVRDLRRRFHHVEVRSSPERTPHLEPLELRHFGAAVSGTGDGGHFKHSMGQLPSSHGGDLDSGFGHYLASPPFPHYWHIRRLLYCICFSAQLSDRESVAIGDCSADGAHVPTLYLFHDYGSEDDGAVQAVAVHRGCHCRAGGNDPAVVAGSLRAILRVVPCWSRSATHPDVVGFAANRSGACCSMKPRQFPRRSLVVRSLRYFATLLPLALLAIGCKHKSSEETSQGSSTLSAPSTAPSSSSPSKPATNASPRLLETARPSGPIDFVDVTAQAGIRFKHNTGAFGKKYLPETMGSGVCIIDYDNDGWPDIFFVNSMDWPEHKSAKSYPALYHNNHDGTFTDVTRQAGLAIESYGLGCAVGDYDNDGYDDLYLTTVGSNHLFHNLGNGKFADVTAKAGVASPGFSASAVWFDYDNDGKLDLFVTHYIDWSVDKDQYCSLDNKNKSYCTPQTYKGESSHLYHNNGNGVFEDVTKKAGLFDPTSKALGVALFDYDND